MGSVRQAGSNPCPYRDRAGKWYAPAAWTPNIWYRGAPAGIEATSENRAVLQVSRLIGTAADREANQTRRELQKAAPPS